MFVANFSDFPRQIRQTIRVKRITSKWDMARICGQFIQWVELAPTLDTRGNPVDCPAYYPDSALQSAIYGIAHAINTGRLDGVRHQWLLSLSGKDAVEFITSIAKRNLSGDDVARFINGRRFKYTTLGWKVA